MYQDKLRDAKIYVLRILNRVNKQQATRYEKLKLPALILATKGILRHFRAWHREIKNEDELVAKVDITAVREIIDDALRGAKVFAHTNDDTVTNVTSKDAKSHWDD